MTTTVHATTLTVRGHGVALRGASGAGKSDLALRLLDDGRDDVRLVADDYSAIDVRDGALWASAPVAIAGLLEVRGVGILRLPEDRLEPGPVRLRLCVELAPGAAVERLPEPEGVELLPGFSLPRLRLDPFQASAAAKVRLAVGLAVGDILPAP